MRDALGSIQNVLVLGGGSDIGLAVARRLVAERAQTVILAARDPEALAPACAELRAAGATTAEAVAFDATDHAGHAAFVARVAEQHGDIDLAVLAFGVLGVPDQLVEDPAGAAALIETNFTGAASVLLALAGTLRAQGHGSIVVLSSVAGERARRSNFVYGASKAGIDAFAQGLGDHLAGSGVQVVVVRPGMVRTKMTAGMKDVPFTTTPEKVAEDIVAGVRRNAHTVWSPAVLRWVMTILRHLPRPIFRRLDL